MAWERELRQERRGKVDWSAAIEMLLALRSLEEGSSDLTRQAGVERPPPWILTLRDAAEWSPRPDPLLRAAARWTAALGWLASIDVYVEVLPSVDPSAWCRRACLLPRAPPTDLPVLRRVEDARGPALDSLWVSLNDLRPSPWPFNEFAERLRVTACALLRATDLSCAPLTRDLDSVVDAELRAVRHEFEGHRGLAARAMEAFPQRFEVLDQSLALLLGDSTTIYVTEISPQGWPIRQARSVPVLSRPPPPWYWRAAWPLYLQPHNERVVAHRARVLLADMAGRFAIRADRANLFGEFGLASRLVRVGVPLAIAIIGSAEGTVPLVVWVPPGIHETLLQSDSGVGETSLDLALAARSAENPTSSHGFASEDYDALNLFDHQTIQYVRGDTTSVETHAVVRPGSCAAARPLVGFFLLDTGMRELSRVIDPDPLKHPRKMYRLAPHPGDYVYSLELLDRACRTADRARYVLTVPPPAGRVVSDLMLVDELHFGDDRWARRIRGRPPVTVHPALTVAAGDDLRFYWELYGLVAEDLEADRLEVHFEVVNVRAERVFVRELGHVAADARERPGTLELRYHLTVPAGEGPLGLGLAVGVTEGTQGVHVARVRVTDTRTSQTATAERAFFVRG